MYTVDPQEARAVERGIKRIFDSRSAQARAEEIGRLFVEALDFQPAEWLMRQGGQMATIAPAA